MPIWQGSPLGRSTRLEPDASIAELRQRFAAGFQRFSPPPPDAEFKPAQLGPTKGEWVTVHRSSASRTLLYFHGGGFIAGSPETNRGIVAGACGHALSPPLSAAA